MVKIGKYDAERLDKCLICGSELTWVFDAPATRDDLVLSISGCETCDTLFHNPRMTETAMVEYYSNGTYMGAMKEVRKGRGTFGERSRALRILAFTMMMSNAKLPKRALDVGCAKGFLLERVKDWAFGVETVGYDAFPDPEAVCEVITNKDKVTGKFDYMTCIHTLEHMYDPMSELEWMGSLLSPGGLLVIEVPNVNYILLEHPTMMSEKTLPFLMKHIGIENYFTMNVPSLESCLVFGTKDES